MSQYFNDKYSSIDEFCATSVKVISIKISNRSKKVMTNYEKAMELLNLGIARKHYTFDNGTCCIVIDLGGSFVGFISPYDKFADVAQGGEHVSYGVIDLEDMMVLDISNRHRYNLSIKKWEDAQ
jgi:hypothetical protein|nr:MAG TPA: hypothetical protein [Caudoviricetes sp.]